MEAHFQLEHFRNEKYKHVLINTIKELSLKLTKTNTVDIISELIIKGNNCLFDFISNHEAHGLRVNALIGSFIIGIR